MATAREIALGILAKHEERERMKEALAWGGNRNQVSPTAIADILLSAPVNQQTLPIAFTPRSTGGGGATPTPDTGGFKTIATQMLEQGETTEDITKAVQQYEHARDRANAGKSVIQQSRDVPAQVRHGLGSLWDKAWDTASRGLDLWSRPGFATANIAKERVKDIRNIEDFGDVADIAARTVQLPYDIATNRDVQKGIWAGLSGKDKSGGAGVLKEAGWKPTDKLANKAAFAVAALGTDLALDPTSYFSLGIGSAGRKLGAEFAKQGITGATKKMLVRQTQSMIREAGAGARKGAKKLSAGEVDTVAMNAAKNLRDDLVTDYNRARQYPGLKVRSPLKKVYDDAIAAGKNHPEAHKAVMDTLSKETDSIRDSVTTALQSWKQGSIQFKLGWMGHGDDILRGSKIGQALYKPIDMSADMFKKLKVGDAVGNAFSYEKHFPGQAAYIRSRSNSMGLVYHQMMEGEVKKLFKNVPLAVRKDMAHAIEEGRQLTGVAKDGRTYESIKQGAETLFRQMADDGVAMGIMDPKDILSQGYVYHWYKKYGKRMKAYKEPLKKGGKDFKDSFRSHRRDLIRTAQSPAGVTLKDAMAHGLNPELDLAKIMMAKSSKHNRDVARALYHKDMLFQYGKQYYKKEMRDAHKWGVAEVPKEFIKHPSLTKAQMLKDGQAWYMPHDMLKSFESFDKLLSYGVRDEEEIARAWRALDQFNKVFKYSKTVARPAYHVNNMLGDMMMGFFDHTPLSEYATNMDRYLRNKSSLPGAARDYNLGGGMKASYEEMVDAYKNHAAGSTLLPSELPGGIPGSEGMAGLRENVVSSAAARGNQMVRHATQRREDFARFSHFSSSVRQEYKRIAKGKKLSPAQHKQAWNEAVRNATERVNKYNIDYSALTPFEQNVARRVIPFYTYTRKATPLLMESSFTSPGRVLLLDKQRRAVENFLGVEHNEEFQGLSVPEHLRDGNLYVQLNNNDEPSVYGLGNFPQGLLPGRIGGSSLKDQMANQLSMLNFGIRAPFEIWAGKNLFTGRKIDSVADYAMNEFNPAGTFFPVGQESSAPGWKKYLGLPYQNLSEKSQIASIKKETDKYQQNVAILNDMLETRGFELRKVTTKNETKWRIVDRVSGNLVGSYADPAQAQEAANKLLG